MNPLEDLLKVGQEQGFTPLEISDGYEKLRAEGARGIQHSDFGDKEKFEALLRLDNEVDQKINHLQQQAMGEELVKQFPDETDRQAFLSTMANIRAENNGGYVYPTEYEPQAMAVNKAAMEFARPKRSYDSISFGESLLGHYAARPRGDGVYDVLVQSAPQEEQTGFKPLRSFTDEARPEMKDTTAKPIPIEVRVDREQLILDAQNRLKASQSQMKYLEAAAAADTGDVASGQFDFGEAEKALQRDAKALDFVQKAPESELVKMKVIDTLKSNDAFKDTIPNDWGEQFLTRPALTVTRNLAQTGAFAFQKLFPEYSKEILSEEGTATVDKLTPGALENRFEDKTGTPPVADLIGQGVESMLTFLGGGGSAKLATLLGKSATTAAMRSLPYLGEGVAKSMAESFIVRAPADAGRVALNTGFSGFGATAYGNSYALRIQAADREPDPLKAEQIRLWAPWLAMTDAVKEMVTERALPGDIEKVLMKGLNGSLGQRALGALKAQTVEGAEEVIGTAIEHFYEGSPGTPEPQSPIEAFKGGFFGAVAFTPALLLRNGVKTEQGPDGRPIHIFDGKEYATEVEAMQAAREAVDTEINNTLIPAGIGTDEDAAKFLEEMKARDQDTVTPEEKVMAEKVEALAPFLPKVADAVTAAPDGTWAFRDQQFATQEEALVAQKSALTPAKGEGTESGGVATPVGGIAPAGGLPQVAGQPNVVNQNVAPVAAPVVAAQRAADIAAFAPGIAYFDQETETPEGQLANQFTKSSRVRIVRYTAGVNPATGKVTDGFVIPEDPNTIYLALNTKQPFMHVLGHEWYHSREEMPQFQAFTQELMRLEPEAWEKAKNNFPTEGKALAEFMADVAGSRFNDPQFWDRAKQQMSPGVFADFVQFVREIWTKIKTQIGARNVDVVNIKEVDDLLASLLPVQATPAAAGSAVKEVQGTVQQSETPGPTVRDGFFSRMEQVALTDLPDTFTAIPAKERVVGKPVPERVINGRVIPARTGTVTDPEQTVADQLRQFFLSKGVKEEEIKWSGIIPWAADKASVTKEEVVQFVQTDGVVAIEENVMSDKRVQPEKAHVPTKDEAQSILEQAGYTVSGDEEGFEISIEDENGDMEGVDPWNLPTTQLRNAAAVLLDSDDGFAGDPMERQTIDFLPTKYGQYVLPGGTDYREVVVAEQPKLPADLRVKKNIRGGWSVYGDRGQLIAHRETEEEARREAAVAASDPMVMGQKATSTFTSTHFPNVPGYIAHYRANTRVDSTGETGTLMEEMQSDRHQQGRKKGYREELPEFKPEDLVLVDSHPAAGGLFIYTYDLPNNGERVGSFMLKPNQEALARKQAFDRVSKRELNLDKPGVPDAPFRTQWPLMLFKRALRDAVAQGHDWIGWTTGQTQADRFDLSKQVEKIDYREAPFRGAGEGTYEVAVTLKNGEDLTLPKTVYTAKELEDVVGKEVAQKIVNNEGKPGGGRMTLSGIDLKVGGQGMLSFYDRTVPGAVNDYVSQWGTGVEKGFIRGNGNVKAVEVVDSAGFFRVKFEDGTFSERTYKTKEDATSYLKGWNEGFAQTPDTPFWKVPITPQMATEIKEKGQIQQSEVTPEQDAEYMQAVAANDVAKQQAMVDAVAKGAGYNEKWWNGERPGSKTIGSGRPVYLSTSQVTADHYSRVNKRGEVGDDRGIVRQVFAGKKPFDIRSLGMNSTVSDFNKILADNGIDFQFSGFSTPTPGASQQTWLYLTDRLPDKKQVVDYFFRQLKQAGFDSVRLFDQSSTYGEPSGDTLIAAEPSQIKSADPVTRDDQGNVIPLSQRFNPQSQDIRQSEVTPEQDAAFAAAEENEDEEAAQKMVDDKAATTEFNTGPLWHHGSFDMEEDDLQVGEGGMHFGTQDAARARAFGKGVDDMITDMDVSQDEEGRWHWDMGNLSSWDMNEEGFDTESEARADAEEQASEIGENEQSDAEELGTFTKVYLRLRNPLRMKDQKNDWSKAIARAKAAGHDGIIYTNEFEDKGSTSYIIFNSDQAKSAEPFTYDRDGNLIPLSSRFTEKDDIKQSEVPGTGPTLSPEDLAALDRGASGLKNAAVQWIRNRHGIQAVKMVSHEFREQVLNEALAKIKRYPRYTDNLIDALHKKPRVVESVDAAILLIAGLEAQRESELATAQVAARNEAKDDVGVGEAMARLGEANAKLRLLLEINDATGTLAGRALNFRRYLLERDYTFARMSQAFRSAANYGGELNAQQEQFVKEMNEKFTQQEKKIKELEARNINAEVEEYMKLFFGEQEKLRSAYKPGITDDEFKKARKVATKDSDAKVKDWFKNLIKASDPIPRSDVDGMPPEIRAALVNSGAMIVDSGVDTLDGFRDALIKKFGADIAPYAESTFAAAKEFNASLRDRHVMKKGKAKPSTKGAADANKDVAAATKKADDESPSVLIYGPANNEPDRRLVKAVVRNNWESGIRGADAIFSATLADLQDLFPDLTVEDLKRIFSNYGHATFPSQEEVDLAMSELNSIARLESAIDDLVKRSKLERTGPQRNATTLEIRRKQAELNELKRKHGFTQRSDNQLKGALDAAETRLNHELEELQATIDALEAGETLPEKPGAVATVETKEVHDKKATLERLRAQRKSLREYLATLQGPEEITDEMRIERTVAGLRRAEESMEDQFRLTRDERLAAAAEKANRPQVTSEEIEERRSYLATLRELIQEDKDLVRPMSTPVMRQLDRAQRQLNRVLSIYDGTFVPPAPERTVDPSTAEAEMLSEIATIRRVLAEQRAENSRPARQLAAAEATLTRLMGIRDGSIVPAGRDPAQALTEEEAELRSQIATLRRVMAEEAADANRPANQLAAAQAAVDKLEALLEGAPVPPKTPREILSDEEQTLVEYAKTLRTALAAERRLANRPQRQLAAAEKALERLEKLLADARAGKFGAPRAPTDPLTDAETDAREQALTVRDALAELRSADPTLNFERQRKEIQTRITNLQHKLKVGDFRKKSKAAIKFSKDQQHALDVEKAKYVELQKKWHTALFNESLKNRKPGKQIVDFIDEFFKFARIFMLGFDFGTILRQGGRTVGRPDIMFKAINAGFRSIPTRVGEDIQWAKIKGHPEYQKALNMGVELTDPDDIIAYKREEAFQSRWLAKEFSTGSKAGDIAANLPLGITRGLARGQIIAINTIRFNMWLAMNSTLSRFGMPTENEMKSYARMANASTGRGSIDGEWERGVGTLFLAYRWAKSGLEYVTLRPLWQPWLQGEGTARSTAVIGMEYGRNLSGIFLFYTLWIAAHAADGDDEPKIEWDPRSTKFGKIPIGNTLVDPTAGLAQWISLLSRMALGEKKTQAGRIVKLTEDDEGGKPAFGQGRISEISTFLRYKLNPVLGAGISITSGRDAVGQKTTFTRETLRLVTPLQFSDIEKNVRANGFPQAPALMVMSFFGMSVQTWEEKSRENLSTEDRTWLYNKGLSVPQLTDTSTVGDVLGQEEDVQKRRGTNKLMTDEAKKALLEKSLPSMEKLLQETRERYKDLPTDPALREKKLEDLQSRLIERTHLIRKRTLRGGE